MRFVLAALLLAAPAQAQGWTHAGPSDKLALQPGADAMVIAVAGLSAIAPELLKQSLAPAACRACNPSLNGVDAAFHDALTGSLFTRETANTLSDVVGYGLGPVTALAGAAFATGPTSSQGAGGRAAVIVVESAAVSAAVVQTTKFLVARERPFVHYGHGAPGGAYDPADRDSHLGFPSGHTAIVTSLGVSAAMVATLQDSSAAPWLWGSAAALSISTGALRMIAEKHYFTDVLAGSLIGATAGVVVPLLHRRGSVLSETGSPGLGPTTIALAGSF